MSRVRLRVMLMATAYAVCSAGAALAQGADTGKIETIVVTAEKRAQSEQDVPASMTALTDADLRNSTITDTVGLAFSAPNVSIYDSGSNRVPRFNIRGIFSEPTNGGIEASVPVTIDGVLQGRTATVKDALYDVDRVEVLLGPQGDIYGANSIAGVLNIYTHEPDSQFGGRAQVLGGSYGLFSTNDVVNVPLSDTVFARVGVTYTHHDGYDDVLPLNKTTEDENNLGARLGVKIILSDDADLLLRANVSTDHDHGAGFDIRKNLSGFLPTAAGGVLDTMPGDRKIYNDTPGRDTRGAYGTSATLNWRLPDVTFTSISAYQRLNAYNFADVDYTNVFLLNTGLREKQRQVSQEFRFTSTNDGPFQYVAGLYFFNQTEFQALFGDLGTGATALGLPLAILPMHFNTASGTVDTNDYALFGQASYAVTDALSIIVGGRYELVWKHFDFTQAANAIFGLPALAVKPAFQNHLFSPQGTIQYRLSPSAMFYVKVAQGRKSGGFNLSTNTNAGVSYLPESLIDYEGGWKTQWFDDRLLFNGNVFYYHYSDLQVNQLVHLSSGLNVIEASNAAKARSEGFELQLEARPIPQLHLGANYGYTDAVYSAFPNANSSGVNFSGNPLQFSAKHSANASAQYDFGNIGFGELSYRIEYQFRSRAYASPARDANLHLDPINVVNMRLALAGEQGWELALWGKNVFNDKYATNISRSPFFAQYAEALGAPPTAGVDLSTQF